MKRKVVLCKGKSEGDNDSARGNNTSATEPEDPKLLFPMPIIYRSLVSGEKNDSLQTLLMNLPEGTYHYFIPCRPLGTALDDLTSNLRVSTLCRW